MQFNPSLAIEPDNTFDVVYQRDFVTPPTGAAHDVGISGLNSMGDVASSTVELLPELSFSKPLHFDDQATAPGGSLVEGHATVVNTGAGSAVVEIDFFDGIPGQGGTQFDTETVTLAPGTSFDINEAFSIGPGGGGSLPQPGDTADVQVVVTNDSDLPVTGPFKVSLNVPPQSFGFAGPANIQAGAGSKSVVVADVNGDGFPDLVVTNEADSSVSIMLGNGDGTFQPQQTFATGPNPIKSLPAGAVTLMDTTTGQAVTFTATVVPGSSNMKWTLTFVGAQFIGNSLANGRYTLTVHAAALGVQLSDVLAADQSFSFFRLYGSLSGDSTVSAADYNLYTAAVRAGTGSALYTQYASYLDWYGNNNGIIDSDDVTLFGNAYKNKQSV